MPANGDFVIVFVHQIRVSEVQQLAGGRCSIELRGYNLDRFSYVLMGVISKFDASPYGDRHLERTAGWYWRKANNLSGADRNRRVVRSGQKDKCHFPVSSSIALIPAGGPADAARGITGREGIQVAQTRIPQGADGLFDVTPAGHSSLPFRSSGPRSERIAATRLRR
jgi:hypothetical protein